MLTNTDADGRPPRPWRALPLGVVPRKTSTSVESTVVTTSQHASRPEDLHVRGEHDVPALHGPIVGGRPPRPWRARRIHHRQTDHERKTSTSVESTRGRRRPHRRPSEDLHVRGEHVSKCANRSTLTGRPPRPWRAHRRGPLPGRRRRKTSTSVESTVSPPVRSWRGSEDLHVRGEHNAASPAADADRGRPPRPWRAHLVTCGFTEVIVRFAIQVEAQEHLVGHKPSQSGCF